MYAPELTNELDKVSLLSPLINVSSTSCCIAFKYYMYGDNVTSGSLEVSILDDVLFRRRYSLVDSWTTGKITLRRHCVGQMEFTAIRGDTSTELMDIAIDEVWVTPGECVGENSGKSDAASAVVHIVLLSCRLRTYNMKSLLQIRRPTAVIGATSTRPTAALFRAKETPIGRFTAGSR